MAGRREARPIADPLVFGLTGPYTLAGDAHPEWERTPTGYRHAGCPSEVMFHHHTRDPYLAPRTAVCAGCGTRWERRQTGAGVNRSGGPGNLRRLTERYPRMSDT